MLKYDFASRINKIEQLLSGMEARAEEIALWGYPAEFISDLNGLCTEIKRLQDVKNANKAEGMTATTQQQQLLREAEGKATMIRQSVRSRLPKEDWNLFGFYHGETAKPKRKEPAEPDQTGTEG